MDGYCCYIHPVIEKRLQALWSNDLEQTQKMVIMKSYLALFMMRTLVVQNLGKLADNAALDQVCKAKSSDILKQRYEIERELVYLVSESKFQSILYLAEDLILKVVQSISYEHRNSRGHKESSSFPGCNSVVLTSRNATVKARDIKQCGIC